MKEVGWNALCWGLIVFGERFFGNEVAIVENNGFVGSSACEAITGKCSFCCQ